MRNSIAFPKKQTRWSKLLVFFKIRKPVDEGESFRSMKLVYPNVHGNHYRFTCVEGNPITKENQDEVKWFVDHLGGWAYKVEKS